MKPAHQLTKYRIGSLKEMWIVSWPLILGLMSMSIMLFVDRLLLSRYSVDALNAAASAGTAAWALMVLPISIAAISEVFVGRYHGQARFQDTGRPVWQMIWLSLLLTPLFIFLAHQLPPILFPNSPYASYEATYFKVILYFCPFSIAAVGISGFFIGIGRVRIVSVLAILSNIVNFIFAVPMIYGWGPFPEMGIAGAAYSTGIAEIFHVAALLWFFLSKRNRNHYGTHFFSIDLRVFYESLAIGFPAGLGVTIEVFAHFGFYKLMALSGHDSISLAALVQSFFFLIFFLFEGISKGVTTICANLLGGQQSALIPKVLRSAIVLHTFFFVLVASNIYLFSDEIINFFLNQDDESKLVTNSFINKAKWSYGWMTIVFLFDGYSRIYAGQLTAAGDTKFLLYAGSFLTLFFYLLPVYLIVVYANSGVQEAWFVIACYSFINCLVYYWRYRSGRWMKSSDAIA